MRCIILVKNKAYGVAWTQYLVEVCKFSVEEIALRTVEPEPRDAGVEEFHILHEWIANRTTAFPLVITDLDGKYLSTANQLNPLRRIPDWRRVVGMLILAFPEAQWVLAGNAFGVMQLSENFWPSPQRSAEPRIEPNSLNDSPAGRQSLQVGYVSLLDGSGLRSSIRNAIGSSILKQTELRELTSRTWFAVAMDDEPNYALLHAYVAYRFGFRSIPVETFKLAKQMFAASWDTTETETCRNPNIKLVFEDVFLDFSDGPQGLSDLAGVRRELFKGIEDAPYRVFVTSGQRQFGDQEKASSNRNYINQQRHKGRHVVILHKPHAGIFNLWERSGLARNLIRVRIDGKRFPGVAAEYRWPPIKTFLHSPQEHTHSAPGVLQTISDSLVERAQTIRRDVVSVKDAIRGAVLAIDALELLAGRTPTISLDALSLKHEFEVIAECQFSGAEYHVTLTPRFDEIRRDLSVIGRSFHPTQQESAVLNGEIKIISKLQMIFREHARFEEERICTNRLRHLQNTLWMRQKPVRYMLLPVVRYLELLLASFPSFIFIIACWIVILSVLYTYTASHEHWYWGIEDALTSFFSIGPPIHEGRETSRSFGYMVVMCLGIIGGFVHLGVFVSHLYSLVARK
jgi:hypothetical protein